MTDLVKILKKQPTLFVWIFFGIGVILFMIGTLFPAIDPMINFTTFLGEIFFGLGIITGASILLAKRRRKK